MENIQVQINYKKMRTTIKYKWFDKNFAMKLLENNHTSMLLESLTDHKAAICRKTTV